MLQLPSLSYEYDALEPHFDARTMEIHHTKHHAGYTNKLQAALQALGADASLTIETILDTYATTSIAVRNNGGGYYNHSLFWMCLSPEGGALPTGELAMMIDRDFGSYDDFVAAFTQAAGTRFGSGWAWLSIDADGHLFVSSTANQDNPLMKDIDQQGYPLLGLDVWEHAYYLNYQNRRPDYINAFFAVIDWDFVAGRLMTYLENK